MKRVLRALLILLVGVCLAGTVAALTALRPREEALPTYVSDNGVWRWRVHTIRQWSLVSPSKRYLDYGTRGFAACGPSRQRLDEGWQYGPFAFEEQKKVEKWPVAVEKAARASLTKKLWVGEVSLEFEIENDGWHVTASGSKNESLAMTFTEEGKPVREDVRTQRVPGL